MEALSGAFTFPRRRATFGLMKQKTKIHHYFEALLIWALPFALRPLPFSLRVRVGGVLVGGIIRSIPVLRKRITRNLALIYPDMQKAEQSALTKRISTNIGARFIEVFYNQKFHTRHKSFHFAPGTFDNIIAAHLAGRPVILVSGHFGQGEAVRAVLARKGHPSAVIYKENLNPIYERHHKRAISFDGAPLIPTGVAGTRAMIKHLKTGGIVSVLLDQRVNDGEPLDFLGHPALSSTVMATLAIRTNALLVPIYAIVRADHSGCDIVADPPIAHTTPHQMTQEINDSLSARVRENPEQWYWLHKRWARPDLQE